MFNTVKLLTTFKKNHEPLLRQILIASGPLISTITLGMTSGFSAILLPQLTVTTEHASWIASLAALPMTFGCLLGAYLMQRFGRRTAQMLATCPALIGWICIALDLLLIGRFFTGLSGGLLAPCTGVYIAETSDKKFRDFLLGAISLAMALGLFLVHVLGSFLHWQTVALVCCCFPVVSFGLLMLAVESPFWLLENGSAQAPTVFFWCRGETEESRSEFLAMQQKQPVDKTEMHLFFKPLFIITVYIVSNQWAGVNAISFYTVSIIQNTLLSVDAYLAMLIVDVIRLIMALLACIAMKKMKRRHLALLSGSGTFVSLFVLSAYLHFSSQPKWYIPMISLVSYIAFITLGFVPLPWAMMGEVFPSGWKNLGSGIASFMGFAAFFSVVKTNPTMIEAMGSDGTFLVYGLVALAGTGFVWAWLPETRGRSLCEIQHVNKE